MQIKQDSYRESQIRTMLSHETDPNGEHYAARLSHWWGDTKHINIEADALALLADAFAGKYIEVNPPKDDQPMAQYRFWDYELHKGKKPLLFVYLPGLTNLDTVNLLRAFDLLYRDTAQETTEWTLEYQVLTRMLVHEKSLLVNPTFLDISEEKVLQGILECMPDAAKNAYQEARRLSEEEIQKLFAEEESEMKKVWAVFGGCVMDEHLIALYEGTQKGKKLAEARADKENRQCPGMDAYVEEWSIEG